MEGREFKKIFLTFKTLWLLNRFLKTEFQKVDGGKRSIPFRKKNMNTPGRNKSGRRRQRIYSDKIEKGAKRNTVRSNWRVKTF